MLRARKARREEQLGPHLPEPIIDPIDGTAPEHEALLRRPRPPVSPAGSRGPAAGERLADPQAEAVEQLGDALELEVMAVARAERG
jgi:hypothetical protein